MDLILVRLIQIIFSSYTLLLIIRVVASWFPNIFRYRIMQFVAFYTDPYLNVFRKIIPPIGGVLDISPIIAFFALQIMERILIYIVTLIG
ncbi:MAG: YggT family protein [Simkaniaceae bacterium]|nr:YggT family protein [Simkaniaceae bacterium]